MEESNDLSRPLLSGFRRRVRGGRRVNPLVQIQAELRPIFAKNNTHVLFSSTNVHEAKKDALYQRLKDIEALSLPDIRRIVNMPVSYVNHTASDSAYFVFCQISHWLNEYPKTLQVLTEHAFRLLRSGRFIFGGDSAELPSTILFFGIDQLLTGYPTFGRFRRWRFNSPNNAVVNKALERIAQELLEPRNNDAIDYKKELWERLNKFTPAVIKRCLTLEVKTENQGNLTLFSQFIEKDFSEYPHIKTAIDEIKTTGFDEAFKNKKLSVDQVNSINDVEILQILIKRLVGLIGTSRFQGKYEDMMELCLVRLMELSDPKEGLNLDPELLKKCLGIINNYFRTSNRRAFLKMTPDTSDPRQRVPNLPIFYFIQRRLRNEPNVLGNYPKISGLTVDYTNAFDLRNLPASEEDFQRVLESGLVRFNVQELFEKYLLDRAYSPVTTSLIKFYGANVNAVRDNGKRLLLWLIEENRTLHGTGDFYIKYNNAIYFLLQEDVTVTQEDIAAAEKIDSEEGRNLLRRLQEKLPQQPLPVATAVPAVDGKGKEEDVQTLAVHVEEKPKSPHELGMLLKRAIINFVDIDEVPELLAKGADVTVLGSFTAARQLVYDRVSMGKKLDDVRKVCGQLQQAYGALANVPNLVPVTRLRRLLDAEQYEVDINEAVMNAGPTAIRELSIRELRKLCKHNLTQHTLGFVLKYVKHEEAFNLFCDPRKNNQPILTLIHKACEEKKYEEAYVWLRVLPDWDDESFLSDTSNFKEVLLKLISDEEVKAGKSSILQTDRKRWAESTEKMVKTLHNRIFPPRATAAATSTAPASEDFRARLDQPQHKLGENQRRFDENQRRLDMLQEDVRKLQYLQTDRETIYSASLNLRPPAPAALAPAVEEKPTAKIEESDSTRSSDMALQRLTEILEREYYSLDVNPLVQVLAGRVEELDKGCLYLHELTADTLKILGEDPHAKINASTGKSNRQDHLRALRWVLEDESNGAEIADADELLKKVGSAVKELSPKEVRKLCACNLSSVMQDFLSASLPDYFELFWSLVQGKKSFASVLSRVLDQKNYEVAVALILALKDDEKVDWVSHDNLDDFCADEIDKGRTEVLQVLISSGVDVNPLLFYAKTGTINEQMVNFLEEHALKFLEGVLLRGEPASDKRLNITVRLLGKNIDLLTWPEKKALGKRNLEAPTLKMLRENGFETFLSKEVGVDVGAMAAIRDRESKPAEQSFDVPGAQPVAAPAQHQSNF